MKHYEFVMVHAFQAKGDAVAKSQMEIALKAFKSVHGVGEFEVALRNRTSNGERIYLEVEQLESKDVF